MEIKKVSKKFHLEMDLTEEEIAIIMNALLLNEDQVKTKYQTEVSERLCNEFGTFCRENGVRDFLD